MLIAPTFRADTSEVEAAIVRYAGVSERSLKEAFLRFMRGVIKRSMGITPPANSLGANGTPRGDGGGLTSSDKDRGNQAIIRDLNLVFTAVTLKHKRKEAVPDPATVHKILFQKYKKPGNRLTRGRPQAYYVDKSKLKQLLGSLETRVGKLASGWLSGAEALGVSGTPAWVARHGASRGDHRLVLGIMDYYITVSNNHVPEELVPELERRLVYGVKYAENALKRETEYLLTRGARESGFDTR